MHLNLILATLLFSSLNRAEKKPCLEYQKLDQYLLEMYEIFTNVEL